MRYRIGDVEKILGVPPVTTRFFEEKGIIHAQRGENGYRSYETFDLNKLFTYRVYRSLDFSLDTALELVDGGPLENLGRRVLEQEACIVAEKRRLQRVLRRLDYMKSLFARMDELSSGLVEGVTPHLAFIKNQDRDRFLLGNDVLSTTRHCFNVMEACLPMYRYTLGMEEDISYGYGVLRDIDESDALLERGEMLGGQDCLHTVICQRAGGSKVEALSPLLERCPPEVRARIGGEVFGHVFHEERDGDGQRWYSELWLPLLIINNGKEGSIC